MKKTLAFVAVLFKVAGFGMIHIPLSNHGMYLVLP